MSYHSYITQDTENFTIRLENVNVSAEEISVIPAENGIDVKISNETLHFNSPKIDMDSIIADLKDKILTIKAKILKPKALENIEERLHKEQKEKEKLAEELSKKNKETEDLKNRYNLCLRTIADFDNARKIWEKKEREIKEYGAKDVMVNLLPLLDTCNVAFASYKDKNLSAESAEILEGMKKIYEGLIHILKDDGLNEISSVGKIFDPYEHEVIMQEETDKFPEGMITEEFQKGYVYKDMLLRSSKVKVAKSKSNDYNTDSFRIVY